MISLYEGAKTSVRVESVKSEKFEAKAGMHQGYVLSSILPTVMVDVVTKLARGGALSELLHADDLVMISETIEGPRNITIKN